MRSHYKTVLMLEQLLRVIPAGDPAHRRVRWWSLVLRLAALSNVALWLVASARGGGAYAWTQSVLSGVFLFGCGYRSFFPTVYLRRITLAPGPASSVLVARLVAMFAEIAFALQLVLLLRQWAAEYGLTDVLYLAYGVGTLLVVAQGFCWFGVATRRYVGELVEELHWTLGGVVVLVASLRVIGHTRDLSSSSALWAGVAAAVFVAFMTLHNLPMYLRRIREHRANAQPLGFVAGVRDMAERRTVSYAWGDWAGEAAWLTPYFTLGAWVSVAMILS